MLTTGATLEACARTLKRAGAARVDGLCLSARGKSRSTPYIGHSSTERPEHGLKLKCIPKPSALFVFAPSHCLKNKGVEVIDIPAAMDRDKREEMNERSGRNTFPQIFIDGKHVGGCDDLFALDRSGKLDPMLGL